MYLYSDKKNIGGGELKRKTTETSTGTTQWWHAMEV